MTDAALRTLMDAIAQGDTAGAFGMIASSPGLARAALATGATRQAAEVNFLSGIGHYVYAGDTALHVASAAHQPDLADALIKAGADVGARNRRGATPLHYAADGNPASPDWSAERQARTISALITGGAAPDARDESGVAPMHRAIRNRSGAAVAALLAGGADASLTNGSGSSPLDLAIRTTGKSRSGSPEAKAQQVEILKLLEAAEARRGGLLRDASEA